MNKLDNAEFDEKFSRGGGGTGIIQMSEESYDQRTDAIKAWIDKTQISRRELEATIKEFKISDQWNSKRYRSMSEEEQRIDDLLDEIIDTLLKDKSSDALKK